MFRFTLFLFFLIGLNSCGTDARYTRSECIVRVNIDWTGTPLGKKEELIESITKAIRNAPNMGSNKVPMDFTIQGQSREYIYYQYSTDCENRFENTEALLEFARERVKSPPYLSVDKNNYEPGSDTIRVSGPSWID
ncbi:hypothetical protein [Idiomarina xiamenensis]|uniref:Uncharacterized protein n=1 Tax=Idiomarina xiamenensis 10-D-4 TaxID=740709 RepID=K2K488_9GAMM|nr:hypothetical protein [Idiomarina xiamenensis]EKE81447.1 hypothetical protein A10D4_10231 [Idiomarina xiamenensis 10-D-4]